jgi:hypothetical protein
MLDMVAKTQTFGPIGTDPVTDARTNRDRAIALAFVEKDEAKWARKVIADNTGYNLWTVYRAIQREIEWARKQIAEMKTAPTSDKVSGPSTPTEAGVSDELKTNIPASPTKGGGRDA